MGYKPKYLLPTTEIAKDGSNEKIVRYKLTRDDPDVAAEDLREGIDGWTRLDPGLLIVIDINHGEPEWLASVLQRFRSFGTPTIIEPKGMASPAAAAALTAAQSMNTINRAKRYGFDQ